MQMGKAMGATSPDFYYYRPPIIHGNLRRCGSYLVLGTLGIAIYQFETPHLR